MNLPQSIADLPFIKRIYGQVPADPEQKVEYMKRLEGSEAFQSILALAERYAGEVLYEWKMSHEAMQPKVAGRGEPEPSPFS